MHRRARNTARPPRNTRLQHDSGALLNRAIELHRTGKLTQARLAYEQILRADPDHFDALHCLGVLEAQSGRLDQADQLLGRALRIHPNSPEAHSNRGNTLKALGRWEQALASYATAISLRPEYPDAINNRGTALQELGRLDEALSSYDQALRLQPGFRDALNNRGNCLRLLERPLEALADYERALAIDPGYAEAWNNRGVVLDELGSHAAALSSYEQALEIAPAYPEALNNRGVALRHLHRFDDALRSFAAALTITPDYADAFNNRAGTLSDLGRYEQAIEDFRRALALRPDIEFAKGMLSYARLQCGDWSGFAVERDSLIADVRSGKAAITPFAFLGMSDSAGDQLRCAEIWAHRTKPPRSAPSGNPARRHHDRIRIAYLSADFGDSATTRLTAGLFERHDRSRFETTAISFAGDPAGGPGARLHGAFDAFIDVQQMSDGEVAELLCEREMDIVVDLMGHNGGSRPSILARRPAPIQVNYLGYPGSMGAEWIDYIVADPFVVPVSQLQHYREKVAYLPDTFQANDPVRDAPSVISDREAFGLPQDGFVFCCFNSTAKINPTMFDVWMRLLHSVEDAVLWLIGSTPAARDRLSREAAARGVAPARILFAPRAEYAVYAGRYRLCDLFLDTLPFNAGTTASDALRAGVPVVTCAGEAFAARMAGSLLNAVGLPELVTTTLDDYGRLALELARDRQLLAGIKRKLERNRLDHPLFDADRFRRNLEAAYLGMWERWRTGSPAETFAVSQDVAPS